MSPDELFGGTVVDGRVDEVDAAVEHRVEEPPGVLFGDLAAAAGDAAELPGTVAERGDFESGAPQGALR